MSSPFLGGPNRPEGTRRRFVACEASWRSSLRRFMAQGGRGKTVVLKIVYLIEFHKRFGIHVDVRYLGMITTNFIDRWEFQEPEFWY